VVLAAFLDHLWQSVLVLGLLTIAAALVRRNAAVVRLWIWRIAALKFLVPFHLLYVVGAWFGYPVRFAEDTVPERLVATLASLAPYVTPAQAAGVRGWPLAACLALVPVAFVPSARLIRQRLRAESGRSASEVARDSTESSSGAPGLGFVRGLLFAAVSMVVLGAPVLAGAVADRLARHDRLVTDARSLFDAPVSIRPAAPGMGQRVRVVASPVGVLVRNASLQDLTALSYGVTLGYVWSDHFTERGSEDWFTGARYDIRITGRIQDPDRFDTYALRIPVTRVLAERYRLEIYVNDRCQPPCGRYGVAIPEDSP
jgi:hypothetical protein